METIRNYLDTMFANMPNTPSVLRAREELWQMMEDKYNELIEEGKTENEAVGTVISEFGNLSELAEAIGIEEEVKRQEIEVKAEEQPKIVISVDEAKDYLRDKAAAANKQSLGICLCIISVVGGILGDAFLPGYLDALAALFMFGLIAAGVVLLVLAASSMKKWNHIRSNKITLSMDATKYVVEEKDRFAKTRSLLVTVGTLLCAMCWLPAVLLDEFVPIRVIDDISGAMFFIFIGIGVMLLVYQAQILRGYSYLLKTRGKETLKATYSPDKKKKMHYANVGVECMMAVFWPTVVCVYLILSFVCVGWLWSWIIWPAAAIAHAIIERTLLVEVTEEEKEVV